MSEDQHATAVATDSDATQLRKLYRIEEADLERVRALGKRVEPEMKACVDAFYEWLREQPYFEEYFADDDMVARVQGLQTEYWAEFFKADVSAEFVNDRRKLGAVHARIGLPLSHYLSGLNIFVDEFLKVAGAEKKLSSADVHSLNKLTHLDASIVCDEFARVSNRIISQQSEALLEMSTPVTAIWRDILMLPIVGIIDSKRSMDIMNAMLSKIEETRARVIILDISGVGVVDTAVANHLIKITKATRLLGCECVISGLSPAIAQTIVELGIDVGEIRTTATLRDALEHGFRATGFALSQSD